MGKIKNCPVDMMAYLKKLPKGRMLVDDVAQVVWFWGKDDTSEYLFENNEPFAMSFRTYLALKRR
jgi:hypothetical protein